jgi:zinc protease
VNVSGLDYGYFSVNCPIQTKALSLTQKLIRDELQKIKSHPPTKSELNKTKNLLLGSIFRVMDNFHELPRLIAYEEVHLESENSVVDYINKISALTEKDLTEAANKYFQDKNVSTAILTPKKE